MNIPEAKFPCIFPDSRVKFRVNAPNAQTVRASLGGLNLTKGPDHTWSGTTAQPLVEGFHYYSVVIADATVSGHGVFVDIHAAAASIKKRPYGPLPRSGGPAWSYFPDTVSVGLSPS